MPIVADAILIDAPADGVFSLSQDYSLRSEWDPFVRAMRFLDGATESAPGVRVWVRAWNGLTMEVRFVSVQRPRSVAMKMTRGPWLFRQFAGTWLFAARLDGQTEVTFRYSFQSRFRLLDPFIRAMLRRDIRKRLHGLKHGAEHGLLERLADRVSLPTS
jgi:ribosome-associated toxin RatA of RatAB toxin-antitoxin module